MGRNDTRAEYPRDSCIHELFESQVDRHPTAVAVEFGGETLSYGELNARANQLARHLVTRNVGAGAPVGLCVARSLDMVVGLLGILKAGGAYVPLDPEYPGERLAFMLRDTGAPVLVTQEALLDQLPAHPAQVVCLDGGRAIADASPHERAASTQRAGSAQDLAYVIYTSGSTGRPKGIGIPHRAISRLLFNTDYIDLDASDRVAQVSNCSFDAATFEIWGALLHGGRLVGMDRSVTLSPQRLAAALREREITALFLTTALFNQVAREAPDAFATLKHLLFGGEAVDPKWVEAVLSHGPPERLLHVYGPTESTTFATWHRVESVAEGATTIPIGRSITNTQAYVLDEAGELVEDGVPGELYLGGDGLARGYLGRPALTAEMFVPNPFVADGDTPGGRLYRTGDRVRAMPGGSLEFLGRIDDQVKIRGFRIELGEIEAVLCQHPGVANAVVLAREDMPGHKRLVAYVVAPTRPPAPELHRFLQEKLPSYMLPSRFVSLAHLPLTPNGKVDRRALPAPDSARPELEAAFEAPRTPLEELLAEIFAKVLGLEEVGIHDGFFELGGGSLLATQVVSRVRDATGAEISLEQVLVNLTVARLAELVERERLEPTNRPREPIRPIPRDGDLPLSFSQERVWFVQQLDPESLAYNFQAAIRLRGPVSVPALEQSLGEIVRRHEIYRTTFPARDGRPVQLVHEAGPVRLQVRDLRSVPDGERDTAVQREIRSESQQPFDLDALPLVRWRLLRLADEDHVLVHVDHHLVHDGWSFNVFVRELLTLYRAFAAGAPSPLPELPIQFADLASWQREWLRGAEEESQLAYWSQQLAGCNAVLELPTDRPRPAVQTFRGASVRVELPANLCRSLEELSRREGATLFMTMLAAFMALLHRHSSQEDFCVGTGVANRLWAESEDLIGMAINNLALRADLRGDPTVRGLLARVREQCLGAYANQDLPFERVVEALKPERDASRNPLFQVMFSFHDSPMPADAFPELEVDLELGINNGSAKFDLNLIVLPHTASHLGPSRSEPGGTTLVWEYASDLFDPDTIERMAARYQNLLAGLAADTEQRVSELPLLTERESRQLLVDWNDTATQYPRDELLHRQFEAQVEETPDSPAVIYGERNLSYRELNARANQLARHLRALGVGPEARVGVCVERSLEMVVAFLGILKAGGAYVPLDPEYPKPRLAFMLEDVHAGVLLTQDHLAGQIPPHQAQVVRLDADWPAISSQSEANLPGRGSSADLAYVIYTSGSTGQPKGTAVPHRAISRLVLETNYVDLDASDRIAQVSNCSFDAATFEIWGALLNGARLIGIDRDVILAPAEFAEALREHEISAMFLTSALFNQVAREAPDAFGSVKHLLVGGEAVDPRWVEVVLSHGPPERLLNGYGPTECTTFAITHPIESIPDGATAIPIGRPISNTQAYILDTGGQPVPRGAVGELYLGGDGLARGYLDRPGLTAEKFVPNPFTAFGGAPGSRLYRTGDRVRHLADGSIECLGRIDHQVKIRGFRIELGEIETTLCQHPDVTDAVVLAREEGAGESRASERHLVAYVVPSAETPPSAGNLRSFLRTQLPGYMVPPLFVLLDRLPVTPNGKIDRKALPAPEPRSTASTDAAVAPRTEAERVIAAIWRSVLGIEAVGREDNFFDLGGHSLQLTRLNSRLRDAFHVELPLHCLFEEPTIAGLGRAIEQARSGRPGPGAQAISHLQRKSRRASRSSIGGGASGSKKNR